MRLGAPIFAAYSDPDGWVQAVQEQGYRAAYCPVTVNADDKEVKAYAEAAARADIVIAEVGAWSNPIASDAAERQAAVMFCQHSLDLADRIGARCCVNIAGSRGTPRNAPHPDNLTEDTFALIVDTVRTIIDAVQPRRTCFTLEAMPWMYPDSVESYLRLIDAVDRDGFGVHLDPVNWVSSPQAYYGNGAMIRDAFARLGAHIKSVHAKDIVLHGSALVHLDEVRPGLGYLDYPTLLHEIAALGGNTPLMVEHLDTEDEYRQAVDYILSVAKREAL